MPEAKISVVIPCFNEERTIRTNIRRISNHLAVLFRDYEIIAVNDGSTDGTLAELELLLPEMPLRIINNSVNAGKGKAVQNGILEGSHEILMFLDADLGIPIEELDKFIEHIDEGFDIVIASRFVPGLKIKRKVSWHRKFMEKAFRLMRIFVINGWEVKDTQCGFKVFKREAAMKIFPRLTVRRFAFDAEVIFVANKLGHKIKELPITLQNPPNSHVRIFRDPANMIWDLLRIRMNDWRGKYDSEQRIANKDQ